MGDVLCGLRKITLALRNHLGVGVRYVDASIPIYIYIYIYIYIGEIMCILTHNLSYILWECVTN